MRAVQDTSDMDIIINSNALNAIRFRVRLAWTSVRNVMRGLANGVKEDTRPQTGSAASNVILLSSNQDVDFLI